MCSHTSERWYVQWQVMEHCSQAVSYYEQHSAITSGHVSYEFIAQWQADVHWDASVPFDLGCAHDLSIQAFAKVLSELSAAPSPQGCLEGSVDTRLIIAGRAWEAHFFERYKDVWRRGVTEAQLLEVCPYDQPTCHEGGTVHYNAQHGDWPAHCYSALAMRGAFTTIRIHLGSVHPTTPPSSVPPPAAPTLPGSVQPPSPPLSLSTDSAATAGATQKDLIVAVVVAVVVTALVGVLCVFWKRFWAKACGPASSMPAEVTLAGTTSSTCGQVARPAGGGGELPLHEMNDAARAAYKFGRLHGDDARVVGAME